MKRFLSGALIALTVLGAVSFGSPADAAAHVRVVRRPRAVVRVGVGFPVVRPLPHVVVRTPAVAVRVAPRVYLPRVAFAAAVVASVPVAAAIAWHREEVLARADEWTEFTFNLDRRGTGLLLDIARGPAQISFAEVVFENGNSQVVDFDDREHKIGVYSLLDFEDGRKVDHVRIVAKANSDATSIGVKLLR